MAIQKSRALLLRRQDLRETSLILHFYTREFGKVKGIVRGVRGRDARYGGGALEVCALDEIVFYERKRGDIYTISQCDLVDFFPAVRSSLEKLSYALYLIELLDSVTTPGDCQPEVFDLTLDSLALLGGESSPKRVARIFEIRLLNLLGLMPALSACVLCGATPDTQARFSFRHGGLVCARCRASDPSARPILAGTVNFIDHILTLPFEKVARVKVASQVGEELEGILRTFLDYHIERRLKTVKFLNAVRT